MNRVALDRFKLNEAIFAWFVLVIAFGIIYFGLIFINQPLNSTNGPLTKDANGFANSIYFSFITALTIGYNDLVPIGISKLLVILEAIASVSIFGLIIGKLVLEKQEELKQEITSEELVNSAITQLYIYRNDLKSIPSNKKGLNDFKASQETLKLALLNIKNANLQDKIKAELVTNSITFSLSKTIETNGKFNQWKKESKATTEALKIAKEIYAQYKSMQFDEDANVGEKLENLNKTIETLHKSLGNA